MAALPPLGGPPPSVSTLKGRPSPSGAPLATRTPNSTRYRRSATPTSRSRPPTNPSKQPGTMPTCGSTTSRIILPRAPKRSTPAPRPPMKSSASRVTSAQGTQTLAGHRVEQNSPRQRAQPRQAQSYYLDTTYNTERSGEEKLKELQVQQDRTLEHAREAKNEDVALEQELYRKQYEELKDGNEARIAKMREDSDREYQRIRDNSTEATEKAQRIRNQVPEAGQRQR